MASGFSNCFSPEDVKRYLQKEIPTLSESVLENILKEKIDGEAFVEMDDDYLREIAPLGGDRIKMKKVIRKAKSSVTIVSIFTHKSIADIIPCLIIKTVEDNNVNRENSPVPLNQRYLLYLFVDMFIS